MRKRRGTSQGKAVPNLSNEACHLHGVVSPDWDLDLACEDASCSCADGHDDDRPISSQADLDTRGAEKSMELSLA